MEPAPHNNNSKLIYSICGILLLLLGIVGGYYLGQSRTKVETSPTQTVSTATPTPVVTTSASTASPKTYTNTKFNYSVTYPSTWTTSTTYEEAVSFISPETTQQIKDETDSTTHGAEGFDNDVAIYYYESISDYTKLAYAASVYDHLKNATTLKELIENAPFIESENLIDFAGKKAYEVGKDDTHEDDYEVYMEHNGHLYILRESSKTSKNIHSADNKKIINSFKFTK